MHKKVAERDRVGRGSSLAIARRARHPREGLPQGPLGERPQVGDRVRRLVVRRARERASVSHHNRAIRQARSGRHVPNRDHRRNC